jgi:hypothetical protein
MDLDEVESALEEAEVPYRSEFVGGDALRDALDDRDIDPELADAGEVFATDPPPGVAIQPGETITLYVSDGFDDDDHGPPDHSKGKKEDKDDD